MTWGRRLDDLFADLEQQAEGLALASRDAEVAELARAEYAEVDLASRLHASVGRTTELEVSGWGPLRGRLVRVGAGWCLLAQGEEQGREEWVVRLAALLAVRGLAPGARTSSAREVTAGLGLGSVLRRLAEARSPVTVVTLDGVRRSGVPSRVGADFVELADDGVVVALPFTALAVVRPG